VTGWFASMHIRNLRKCWNRKCWAGTDGSEAGPEECCCGTREKKQCGRMAMCECLCMYYMFIKIKLWLCTCVG